MASTKDTLRAELKNDLSFNPGNLSEKISIIPALSSKWHDRLVESRIKLVKQEHAHKTLTRRWYNYYCGRQTKDNEEVCPLKLDLREVREIYLPSEPEILASLKKTESIKAEISELEHAVKQMNSLNWVIKEYIEWQKFSNGIN